MSLYTSRRQWLDGLMKQVAAYGRGGMAMLSRKIAISLLVLFVHAIPALGQPAESRQEAWQEFVAAYGETSVEWEKGALRLLRAYEGRVKLDFAAATEEEIGLAATAFLTRHSVLLGVPDNQLRLVGVGIGHGDTVVRFEQRCHGIPVEHARLTLVLHGKSLVELNSRLVPDLEIQVPPSISAAEAEAVSRKNRPSRVKRLAPPELVVSDAMFTLPKARLAWRIGWDTVATGVLFHYIDAHTEDLLATVSTVRTATGTVSGIGNLAQPGLPHLPYQGPASLTLAGLGGITVRLPGTLSSFTPATVDPFLDGFPVDDVNNDGICDFAEQYTSVLWGPSTLIVWSGRTGTTLFALDIGTNNAVSGQDWVCGAGDRNNDGFNDILLLTEWDTSSFPWPLPLDCRLHVVSGLDGTQLSEWPLPPIPHGPGYHLTALDDINGDGYRDYYLREPSVYAPQPNVTGVYSGLTNSLLYKPDPPGPYIYPRGYPVGDTNGDGVADVASSADYQGDILAAYAGVPGTQTFTWTQSSFPSRGPFPDYNGDGRPEICIIESLGGTVKNLAASIYSGSDNQFMFGLPNFTNYNGGVLEMESNWVGVAGKFIVQLNDASSAQGDRVDWYYGPTGEHAATDVGAHYPERLVTIGDLDNDNQIDALSVDNWVTAKARIYGMRPVGEADSLGNFGVQTGNAQFCNATLTGTGFRVRTIPGVSENLSAEAKLVGGVAALTFNSAAPLPDQEYRAAQVNAAYYVGRAHSVAKAKALLVGSPMADALDVTVEMKVNADPLSPDAPGHYALSPAGTPEVIMTASGAPVGLSGNFFANGSSGSVIYHEYGHFVYATLAGVGPDIPLDEALADAFAMYVSKQGVIGEDMIIDSGGQVAGNGWLRNYDVPIAGGGAKDAAWPPPGTCTSNHCIGQPLAAFLWGAHKMLEAEEQQYGIDRAEFALIKCIWLDPSSILSAVGKFIECLNVNGKLYDGDALYDDLFEVACQHGFGPNNVVTTSPGGLPASLGASPATIDPAVGGVTKLSLNACPMYAGHQYAILGSLSVSELGIPFKAKHMPIVYDPLTYITATNLNAWWYSNTLGSLSADGKATAQVTVSAVPVLTGITLYFAAAIWGGGDVGPAVSVPAELKLL